MTSEKAKKIVDTVEYFCFKDKSYNVNNIIDVYEVNVKKSIKNGSEIGIRTHNNYL